MIPRPNWFLLRPPSALHGVTHTARVMALASTLARDTRYGEAVLWAAACHDLRRMDDGPDPDHGVRAGRWVRDTLPGLLRYPLPDLEVIARACDWHVCPDAAARWRHPVLTLLKDADGLDRVRLGDLDVSYLRSPVARDLAAVAQSLFHATRSCQTVHEVWDAASGLGLPTQELRDWSALWSGALEEVIDPRGDGATLALFDYASLRENEWFREATAANGYESDATPWPSPSPLFTIPGASDSLTPAVEQSLYAIGFWCGAHQDAAVVAPLRAVPIPAELFHVTPAYNESGIARHGLRPGRMAGVSTTGRDAAGAYLHVCFSATEAEAWTKNELLGERHSGPWLLYRIDASFIEGRLYRDPASQTGYLLAPPGVAPLSLSVAKRWTAGSPAGAQ